jgi:hypothetical protein
VTGRRLIGDLLKNAETRLWADFQAAGNYTNPGNIGTGRERSLIGFLAPRLPSRFAAATGEIVDLGGDRSGQIDVVIYDQAMNAPLLADEKGLVLLPAEAVLAVIEVKSTLNMAEAKKVYRGLDRVHSLQPYGSSWGRAKNHDADGLPRVFGTCFAYDTTINTDDWVKSEMSRIREAARSMSVPCQYLDWLAVLSRGVLRPAAGRGALEPANRGVLGMWYFGLLNFLVREADRRKPVPWNLYEEATGRTWAEVAAPQNDAPEPIHRSDKEIREYIRHRRDHAPGATGK